MEDMIQALVEEHLDPNVRMMHLHFRPREDQGLWAPKLGRGRTPRGSLGSQITVSLCSHNHNGNTYWIQDRNRENSLRY